MSEVFKVQRLAAKKFPNVLIVHRLEQGLVISDKRSTLDKLASAGVTVPKLTHVPAGDAKIFVHELHGAGHSAAILEAPVAGKHNVEYIDTRHSIGGGDYFVSIRAMSVGPECLACFARARDASDCNPVVHNLDTPRDPKLLNELHRSTIRPNWRKVRDICQKTDAALGFGMYAIDILPCSDTGKLYVCEVNLKLEEFGMRNMLNGIREQLIYGNEADQHYPERAAHAFFQAVRGKGLWW